MLTNARRVTPKTIECLRESVGRGDLQMLVRDSFIPHKQGTRKDGEAKGRVYPAF